MLKNCLKCLVIAATLAVFITPAFAQQSAPEIQNQLQGLLQQVQQLQSQVPNSAQPLTVAGGFIPGLTRNFGIGSADATSGGEVSAWQIFLVGQNKGPKALALGNLFVLGVPRGYFGRLTGEATVEWQISKGIVPTSGTTYCQCVGPRTRAALANLGQSWESSFDLPYPVSWSDWNRAQVALTKASLTKSQSYYELRLYFKVNGTGFCSSTLKQTLKRLVSGQGGDRVAPVTTSSDCTSGGTLYNQEAVFTNIPTSEQEITIISIPGYNDPAWQQTSFKLAPQADGSIRVVAVGGQTVGQLRVVTPNGGETTRIREATAVRWTGPAVIAPGSALEIALIDGPTAGRIRFITDPLEISNNVFNWTIDSVGQVNVLQAIQPGAYRLRLTLYDGWPCLGGFTVLIPNCESVKVIAQDESDATFTINPTVFPVISSISPASGPVGTMVVLTGLNFAGVYTRIWMEFGRTGGYPLAIISDPVLADSNTLRFVIPQTGITAPGLPVVGSSAPTGPLTPGLYVVYVGNDKGSSNIVNFTVTGPTTSATPSIISILPTSGSVATTVTITGYGFTPTGNRVEFRSGNNLVFTSIVGSMISGTKILFNVGYINLDSCLASPGTACLPRVPDLFIPGGTYQIVIANTNGVSNSVNFTVIVPPFAAPTPIIYTMFPILGPIGTTITITGSGFTSSGNEVDFLTLDTVPQCRGIALVASNGSTVSTLSFTVPQYAGSCGLPQAATLPVAWPIMGLYKVVVKNTNGTSNSVNFTVTAAGTSY